MLPRASVLTNKNYGVQRTLWLLVAGVGLGLCGCTPPGPRALLQGKQLIDEARYGEAVTRLEKATALLPRNALAWNYLGLAYHGSRQPEQAAKAYRTALALDHKLSAVRYNLGALYLEQNNLAAAVDELRSYTLLQPGAIEGWLKLGTALSRARRLDEAERSFRTALELNAKHPEALNGLGLIQIQRRRWQDALNHFNLAALQEPTYGPALLNSAVVQHQYLNNRPAALQRYRQYLSLQPRPADWEAVAATARLLEQELNPPPVAARPVLIPAPALPAPRTNAPVTPASPPARLAASAPSASPPPAPRTNVASATSSLRSPAPSASTIAPVASASVRPPAESPRQPAHPPPGKGSEALTAKPPEVEVAHVPSEFVIKPAQDLTRATPGPAGDSTNLEVASAAARPVAEPAKRSLLARLIPFAGKSKPTPSVAARETNSSPPASETAAPGPAPQVPRYAYLSPAAPSAGDHSAAELEFKRGIKAQKGGNRAQAVAAYQAAVKADPAYYDAYYNLGLAALDNGDARLSLWAYEIALALKPDAEDARYNFALALKTGGYWEDAADQLQRLLNENPSDARAHLSLANLYSQQLQQPKLAREHYQRLLELNPRHPEAAKVRYWLAANP